MFHNYRFKNLDIKLILAVITLTIIGIFVIGSANESNQQKQIIGMILGVIVMSVMTLIDYDFILHFHWIYYGLVIALLIAVLLFGDEAGGATRWIDVGVRFQPSELGKILLILFFSWFLMMHEEDINKPKILGLTILLSAFPLFLIEKEPDLSTTIVTMMIICVMMFVVGLSYKLVAIVLGITVPSIIILLLPSAIAVNFFCDVDFGQFTAGIICLVFYGITVISACIFIQKLIINLLSIIRQGFRRVKLQAI